MGDRVAVMHGGRLLQVAEPRDLYDRPCNRTVAAFVGQSNLWDGRVRGAGRVATELGELACDTAGFQTGATTTVLVRPEHVVPSRGVERVGTPNVFSGRIAQDRFIGAVRRCDFAIGDRSIAIETSIRDDFTAVSIPPEAIRLLPPDDLGTNPEQGGSDEQMADRIAPRGGDRLSRGSDGAGRSGALSG